MPSKRTSSLRKTQEESRDVLQSPKQKRKKNTPNDKNKTDDDDKLEVNSFFGDMVAKAGFILKKGDVPNQLNCDMAVFRKNLSYRLKLHPTSLKPEIAEEFVKGLESVVDDPVRLKWALLYTQTIKDCETARGAQQDSLIRLCLNIDILQPCLIQLLTEKLLLFANDDEISSEVNIPVLVLANLRWLDYIVDYDVLTTKIIEMIDGSPPKVQKEIITYAPDIVNDANHPRLADILCNLYDTTPCVIPAVLDTLSNLTLPPDRLAEVHHSVLKTLHGVLPEQLPIVLKFLLANTKPSVAYQVLSDIRLKIILPGECLPSKASPRKGLPSSSFLPSAPAKDNSTYELQLLENIKIVALIHKFLALNWLKAIHDVYDFAAMKPIDFLVLLILHGSMPSQRQAIESITRNKIRTGTLTDSVLEKIFTNHIDALKEYFESLKKISSLLMRSSEGVVSQAGATLYKLAFLHMDGHYRQETMLSLLQHRGDTAAVRHTTLSLLSTLAHQHTHIMSKFTIFLKSSLQLLDQLSMREAKKLMDVVTCLVFCPNAPPAMQDELMILVRKQLCHTDSKYKHIGVVTAALIVKNMVKDDDNQSNTTSSLMDSESSKINEVAVKEAENLLGFVFSSTANAPLAAALFMDEMASISLREKMNSKIEEWMCDKMTNDFQRDFVTDFFPDATHPQEPFPMAPQWNLDAQREEGSIALNLGPLVVKSETTRVEPSDVKTRLIHLAPQFRLLRMLECRIQSGDLCNIDALLGCPVICPTPEVFENFDSLAESEKHAALSCLFYVTNWFRELLNAFVTQKDSESKNKVYQRMGQVIELEQMIVKYLPKCGEYVPPVAVFNMDCTSPTPTPAITTLTAGTKGRKAKGKGSKSKGKTGDTQVSQAGTQAASQLVSQVILTQTNKDPLEKVAASTSTVNMASLRPFLRELHFDVFNLFFRKLALPTDPNAEGYLSLTVAEFLLTDLNSKLEYVFSSSKRGTPFGGLQDTGIGHSHLDLFTAEELFQHVTQFIKPICIYLEKISEFFSNLIRDNDGIMDAPNMFTDKTKPVMRVMQLLFTTLCSLISWRGLQQDSNQELLSLFLRLLARRSAKDASKTMEQEQLIETTFTYLSAFHSTIVDLGTATILVQNLKALMSLPQHEDLSARLKEVIESFLKREWYVTGGERDKGPLFHLHLHTLLQIYLKQSKEPLQQIEVLCSEGLEHFTDATNKDPTSESFPTLNKNSLTVYYKVVTSFLVSSTTKSLSSAGDDKQQLLSVWKAALKILHTLVLVLKSYYSKQLLSACLRMARPFLEYFLRSALPLMDSCLREHNKDVVMLLKDLQTSTRFLQNLCTHSKVKQDVTLTRFVPLVRRSLETLVYRVKAMLARNMCQSAFWMGTLKNRDIHGEEILSQSSNAEVEEEEEEEEEEDQQSDVELGDDGDQSSNGDEDKITDYSDSF